MIIIKGTHLHQRNFANAFADGHDAETAWTTTKSGYIDEEKCFTLAGSL
jgi:hypothetical protein